MYFSIEFTGGLPPVNLTSLRKFLLFCLRVLACILVDSAILVGSFHEVGKLPSSFCRELSLGSLFLHVFEPVQHVVLFKPVLRRAPMPGVHEVHHLFVLDPPAFFLCHIWSELVVDTQTDDVVSTREDFGAIAGRLLIVTVKGDEVTGVKA